MKKIPAAALVGIAGCLLTAQFIRIQRTNPALKGDLTAPPQIKSLLRGACYDCHSNETRWPWYAYIAPVSWLVDRDVERGTQRIEFFRVGILLPYYAKTKTSVDEQSVARRNYAALEVSLTPCGRWLDAGRPCRAGTMDRVGNWGATAKKTRE